MHDGEVILHLVPSAIAHVRGLFALPGASRCHPRDQVHKIEVLNVLGMQVVKPLRAAMQQGIWDSCCQQRRSRSCHCSCASRLVGLCTLCFVQRITDRSVTG